jgi:hypothetical protein
MPSAVAEKRPIHPTGKGMNGASTPQAGALGCLSSSLRATLGAKLQCSGVPNLRPDDCVQADGFQTVFHRAEEGVVGLAKDACAKLQLGKPAFRT